MVKAAISDYSSLGDYALIGDCETAALVSKDGSIDWYCPDRFDAPAVFCRVLDANRGGYLSVRPVEPHAVWRRYRDRTNVLETTFTTDAGTVRLTDFMPVQAGLNQGVSDGEDRDAPRPRGIIRCIEALSGSNEMELRFKPTFDYAQAQSEVHPVEDGAVARGGSDRLRLWCPGIALTRARDGSLHGRLTLNPGERVWVALTPASDAAPDGSLTAGACEELRERTTRYWEDWAAKCTYRGPYQTKVLRSALALKLMTYAPTGAIVAAPTASLPEEIRGERNWDYRYAWLRDSSYTIFAMMGIGYFDEARSFYRWLIRAVSNDPTGHPQILYGIDGRHDVAEVILPHLEGYRRSGPVRIGNGAATQRQLDVYGEVMAAAYTYLLAARSGAAGGRPGDERPSPENWSRLSRLANVAAQEWREPDSGIWEVRGAILQPFLYSRLMCWFALAAAVRIADDYGLAAPVAIWKRNRDAIRQEILERGFDQNLGAFTQSIGSTILDASALHVVLLGFLPPTDSRVQSTVQRIRSDLTRDGLVYRYLGPDGLAGGEGIFTLCTFWLVNALARCGDLDPAYDLFERLLDYTNDVGLMSEEIDPTTGEALGNTPQAFSHVGVIQSALNLAAASHEGIDERAQMAGERFATVRRAVSELAAPPRRKRTATA